MSLTASVVDGVIQESSSAASLAGSSSSSSTSSAYNQDTFLQLLVAEVQNQDPLEPTSNTEWVSQYATFSQLESMNNMSASYELSRASALVGQTVQIKVTSSTGTTSIYQGKVDYVTYEENKAYLS
ncbi:MAG: flagellar hook capping protein, partial [Lachnospiraceae bacterium]|nr:flagellar hook capping protein [Lachnospiraceae bacterium]